MGTGKAMEFRAKPAPTARAFLALIALALTTGSALAQGRVSLAPTEYTVVQPPGSDTSNALTDATTYVSFIDNALPRTQVRTYLEDGMRVRRPTMAEFFQPKGGLPNSSGPPLPETGLDYFDWATYVEVAIWQQFSTFLKTPFRWVNEDVNRDVGGLGDIDAGFKFAFISTSSLLTTFQFRTYIPTAVNSALGTRHVSIEPALLLNYHFLERFTLEGEGRFWVPIGGTDFAGNIVRYGAGVSYRQPLTSSIWLAPVVEGVGWTVLSGKELVPGPTFEVKSAADTTIFNMYGGLRLGFGEQASVYAGYGRAITGPSWYKDVWRIEFRFFF
jgi:hypothetical protein